MPPSCARSCRSTTIWSASTARSRRWGRLRSAIAFGCCGRTDRGGVSHPVFVVAADPIRAAAAFVAAFRRQVEVVVGGVHHVDAAGVGRIGVEDAAGDVLDEDADALAVGFLRVLTGEI